MLRCVYYCSLFTRFCSCVFLGLCCFVFFFKQKTAYEMRISDWSSDVCSSDLRSSIPAVVPPGQAGSLRRCRPCRLDLCLCCARRLGRLFVAGSAPLFRPDWFPGGRSEEHTSELQSLMRISYAGFCLKKKKNAKRDDENHMRET